MLKKLFLGISVSILGLSFGVVPLNTFAQFGNTDYVEDIGVPGAEDGLQGSKLLDIVKNVINWALGLLATVALVLCLYAGFLMTTAAGDDKKFDKGKTIMKQAAIGLVIIGFSWMIVSLIFWLVGTFTS